MPAENKLEERLLQLVYKSERKTTFASLFSCLRRSYKIDRNTLKYHLSKLVEAGNLRYTTRYGGSFIEVAYDRPRIVSDRVAIVPEGCSSKGCEAEISVMLSSGAAFGSGDHPTTRLAIKLIDHYLKKQSDLNGECFRRALDIGTGSGILAIVAAKLGAARVEGIDIDPCSISEACKNAYINGLENGLRITDDELGSLYGEYDLVMANLRTPTLMAIRPTLEKITQGESTLIFSGMKDEETEQVCGNYRKCGFDLLDQQSELGWSAICLVRGSVAPPEGEPSLNHSGSKDRPKFGVSLGLW